MGSNALQRIEELRKKAEAVLAIDVRDASAAFLPALEDYLLSFDAWQKSAEASALLSGSAKLADAEKAAYKAALEKLLQTHEQVTSLAESAKDAVLSKIGEVRKRSQALKSYIDRYPSRITITGKRQG